MCICVCTCVVMYTMCMCIYMYVYSVNVFTCTCICNCDGFYVCVQVMLDLRPVKEIVYFNKITISLPSSSSQVHVIVQRRQGKDTHPELSKTDRPGWDLNP